MIYILTIAIILLYNWLGRTSGVVDAAIYGALAITLASGLHYIVHAARVLSE